MKAQAQKLPDRRNTEGEGAKARTAWVSSTNGQSWGDGVQRRGQGRRPQGLSHGEEPTFSPEDDLVPQKALVKRVT